MGETAGIGKQDRIVRAKSWLKRAQRDYQGFTKVVGRQYIQSKKAVPDDPALAVYLLQQASEKTVKAIAIASGKYEEKDLRVEYSHNSLMLLSDVLLRLLDAPFMEPALNFAKLGLGERGKKLPPYDEIKQKFEEIKRNIAVSKDRPPDAPDWLKEFALLPREQIHPVVTMLLNLRSTAQSLIHQILKPNLQYDFQKLLAYLNEPTDANLQDMFAPSLRDSKQSPDALKFAACLVPVLTGETLKELMTEALGKDTVDLTKIKAKIGKRADIEKQFLPIIALMSLMFLAAFTFAHESWTRYPRHNFTGTRQEIDLDCESYTEQLGVAACLRELGELTRVTVFDIEKFVETVADYFSYV